MTFKIICIALLSAAAIAFMIMPRVISEKKYPNNKQRIRLVTRIRLGLFLGMLILLFLCLVIK